MRIVMSVIWLVLALLFLLLGLYYYSQSEAMIPHFEVPPRPFQTDDSRVHVEVTIAGSGLDEPLQEFVSRFNEQIDKSNGASSKANRLTAYGYYLASFAALVSMVIEWREILARLFKSSQLARRSSAKGARTSV